MTGPDPEKVYVATDSFVTEIDGHEEVVHKKELRPGNDPMVIRYFPKLWIEADQDPETVAYKRLLAEALKGSNPSPPAAEPSARGLTLSDIQNTFRQLRVELDRKPTRAEVATALHTTEPTLKRAQQDLGKAGWPPI